MDYCKDEALVINKCDYRETSQIITLFTRDYGKLKVLAKGAKRAHNNFEGPLDLLQYAKITFINKIKPGYGYSSGLNLLIDCKIQGGFEALRDSLDRFYQANYLAELLNELIPEGEKYPELFDLTLRTLQALVSNGSNQRAKLVVFSFEAQAIKYLGYMPHTKFCAQCATSVLPSPQKSVTFSSRVGGVLCGECASRQGQNNHAISTNLAVLSLFHNLANALTTSLDRIKITDETAQGLRNLLRYYISCITGKELKTFNYV